MSIDYVVMEKNVSNWVKELAPFVRQERTETQQKRSERITTEDIVKVDHSDSVREAVEILDCVQQQEVAVFSQDEFVTVRSYLQYQISIQNANRTSIIWSFNKKIHEERTHHETSGQYVFSFSRHKTSHNTCSIADVSIDDVTFRQLEIFVTKMRVQVLQSHGLEDGPNRALFCTRTGWTQRATNMFKAVGVTFNVTNATIRHAAATTSFNEVSVNQWHDVYVT